MKMILKFEDDGDHKFFNLGQIMQVILVDRGQASHDGSGHIVVEMESENFYGKKDEQNG